jgi:hypothetical protein
VIKSIVLIFFALNPATGKQYFGPATYYNSVAECKVAEQKLIESNLTNNQGYMKLNTGCFETVLEVEGE